MKTIADAMIRIDPILQEGYWMRLQSPWRDGDQWRCGLTPKETTGWNGQPDIEGVGKTAIEAIDDACEKWANDGNFFDNDIADVINALHSALKQDGVLPAHTPPAPAGCVCGHAAEAHEGAGCNSHVSALLPDATMAMACTCAAYTPAPAGEQEGEHDGN